MATPIHISSINGGSINVDTSGFPTPPIPTPTPERNPNTTRLWWTTPRDVEPQNRDGGDYSDLSIEGVLLQENIDGIDWHSRTDVVSVEIGNTVTEIGEEVFIDCGNLASVVIPDSVELIEQSAFYDCVSLTKVTILENGGNANDVKEMMIDSGVQEDIEWIGDFEDDEDYPINTCFTMKDGTVDEYYIEGSLNDVWMSQKGFSGTDGDNNAVWLKNIQKVVVGSNVTEIGSFAFYDGDRMEGTAGLSNFTEITLPDGLVAIREQAFFGCDGLERIDIPFSVETIENDAFRKCSSLASVKIGNGVEHIGQRAFSECTGLSNIEVGENVKYIDESAFWGCSSLTSVDLPSTIQHLGRNVFESCSSLTHISLPGFTKFQVVFNSEYWGIPDGCTVVCSNGEVVIGSGDKPEPDEEEEPETTPEQLTTFTILDNGEEVEESYNIRGIWTDKWNYDNDFTDQETNNWLKTIKAITVGTNVTEIGSFAFYDGDRAPGTTGMGQFCAIRIPNTVTKIGSLAFNNCTVLDNVNVPDSVVEIGSQAFQECFGLETITIGTGVEYIGPRAFKECLALREITFTGENLKSIGNAAFRECGNLETINIPNGTSYIGGYAFCDCSSLSELTIPESVKFIGNCVFKDSGLAILELPGFTTTDAQKNVELWGIPNGCKVTCEDGSFIVGGETPEDPDKEHTDTRVTYTEESGLEPWSGEIVGELTNESIPNISNVKTVEIGNGVTSIGERAFWNCSSLSMINVPENTAIGRMAFFGCSSLVNEHNMVIINNTIQWYKSNEDDPLNFGTKYIAVPSNITKIAEQAFSSRSEIKCIVIPDDAVLSIDEYAFAWNGFMETVIIGNGVTSVAKNAFLECSANITFHKTTAEIQSMNYENWGLETGKKISCSDGVIEIR